MAENDTTGIVAFARSVRDGWDRHNGAQMSGGVAFFFALSAAPLLIVVASVAVFILGQQVASGQLASHLVPIIGEQATAALQDAVRAKLTTTRTGVLAIAAIAIGTIMGAAGAVGQLRTSLNVVLGRGESGSGLRSYASDWLTSIVAVFAIAAAGVILIASWVVSAGTEILPGGPLHGVVQVLISITLYYVLVVLGYWRLPAQNPPFRASLAGAGVATAIGALATLGMVIFLESGFAATIYGTAASFFMFLMWLWMVATGFIMGAETVLVVAERRQTHPTPETNG